MEEANDGSADFATLSETASLSSKESDSIEVVSLSGHCFKSDLKSDLMVGYKCIKKLVLDYTFITLFFVYRLRRTVTSLAPR